MTNRLRLLAGVFSIAKGLLTSAASIVLVVSIVCAQELPPASSSRSTITVTAAATADRVRFTAPTTVVQMRIEVYASNGEKLFDNEIRGGNMIDWHLQDGQAERLSDGSYLCVVTSKSLSGRMSQKLGKITIENAKASVQSIDATQFTAQQTQAVGPLEENASLTVLKDGETQTATVVAHNGTEGQLIRGRGALSFRMGDFYSGKDTEQMRLTPEGNLGIGITHPAAKLDVDGLIRSTQGIVFPDGSIQFSAARKTFGAGSLRPGQSQKAQGQSAGLATDTSGTGTTGKIPKWLDGVNGVLTDSIITELNGNIGINGPPDPTFKLDVTGHNRFRGPSVTFYLTGQKVGGNEWAFQTVDADGRLRIFDNTTGGERFTVSQSGNVGIGATGPLGRLQVVTTNDTTPGNIPAWDSRHFVIGAAASTGGIGLSYNQTTNVGYIEALSPSVAWRNLVLQSGGGNVGIGTTNPTGTLHVRGANPVRILGDPTTLSGTESVDFMARSSIFSSDLGGMRIQRQSNGDIDTILLAAVNASAATERMRIRGNGNVGIGIGSPSARLHAVAGPGGVGVRGDADFLAGVDSIGGQFSNPGNTAAIAIRADGNAVQTLDHGGWVKAMAYVDPGSGIVRRYNSQASGFTRSVPPCGFSFIYSTLGNHVIDFGFDITNRFVSVTTSNASGARINSSVCCLGNGGSGRVPIQTYYNGGDYTDTPFFIIVH